jgi:hypothetical protein
MVLFVGLDASIDNTLVYVHEKGRRKREIGEWNYFCVKKIEARRERYCHRMCRRDREEML